MSDIIKILSGLMGAKTAGKHSNEFLPKWIGVLPTSGENWVFISVPTIMLNLLSLGYCSYS